MIYLNNASTTKPSKEVLQDFMYCAENFWANPSDVSLDGIKAKQIVYHAQEQVATYINAEPEEIVFTSGGSETNNWAIKGFISKYRTNEIVIITTPIEHPSVYNTCKYLETLGYIVEYVPVNCFGEIRYAKLEKIIEYYRDKKIFASIMMANNEIGTINKIKTISKMVHQYNGTLHVDAVQAFGQIPISVKNIGIDLMSVSFHKFNGFKNCGFLYVKKGIELVPLIHGGHQFESRRSGTENVPMIYALGNQVERMSYEYEIANRYTSVRGMSDYLLNSIYDLVKKENMEVYLNGDPVDRLPNNLSLTFKGINAELLITLLNEKEITISAGSACCSGEKTPSRILKSIGLSDEEAFSTVRISLSHDTAIEECDKFVEILGKCLRSLKMIEGDIKTYE